jgi:hypothetical protein
MQKEQKVISGKTDDLGLFPRVKVKAESQGLTVSKFVIKTLKEALGEA